MTIDICDGKFFKGQNWDLSPTVETVEDYIDARHVVLILHRYLKGFLLIFRFLASLSIHTI
jgi:hypothetical protein